MDETAEILAKDEYKYGRDKEQKVAQLLRNKGASVKTSSASKGAADLTVTFPSGTKWNVQIKASRTGKPASPSKRDIGRLKQSSTKRGTTPAIAKVSPKVIEYTSARSGRKLTPPPEDAIGKLQRLDRMPEWEIRVLEPDVRSEWEEKEGQRRLLINKKFSLYEKRNGDELYIAETAATQLAKPEGDDRLSLNEYLDEINMLMRAFCEVYDY